MSRTILGLALIAALAGCKDKKKDAAKPASGTGSAAAGAPASDQPAVPAPGASGAAAKNADLAKLSVDSELVAGLDWQAIRNSAVYKKLETKLDLEKDIAKFKAACGFDPRDVVERVTVGITNFEGEVRDKTEATFIVHGADKAKVMACFDNVAKEIEQDDAEVTRDGDVVIVKPKGSERGVGFTFGKGEELIVVVAGNIDKAAVEKVAAGGSGLPARAGFAALYDLVGTGATAYVVMNENSKLLARAQDLGMRPTAGVAQLTAGDGLAADVRLRFANADEPKKLAETFQSQVQAMAGFVDKVELKAEGNDLRGTASASLAKLENAMRLLFGSDGTRGK